MEIFATLDGPRTLLFFGLGAWLAIAVFNNIVDRGTNIFLMGMMFSMKLLKEDPMMGNGLKHRAIGNVQFPRAVLTGVVIAQIIVAALLLLTAVNYAASWADLPFANPRGLGNLSAMGFTSLWIFFMCGGLWFAYWMKQIDVQASHMTLFIISIGLIALVNLPG